MSIPMEKRGLIIAATGSNTGKTTITLAIAGALRKRGLKVAPFKCGPDYLDPTYLAKAAGKECENLDPWMMGSKGLEEVLSHAMKEADIAIVEGVMGLFDGVAGTQEGSTAEVAALLGLPVVLVLDASGMSATAGAMFHGLRGFDNRVNIKGLICNRVAGKTHRRMLEDATGREFFCGAIPRMEGALTLKSRHLGLLKADERSLEEATLDGLIDIAEKHVDVDKLLEIAEPLYGMPEEGGTMSTADSPTVRIAIARDDAFHFYYPYNLWLLRSLGAELVEFSPLVDRGLPEDVDGVYMGGGYPECFAKELSANRGMLRSIRGAALSGMPVYGECGGLIYLCDRIRLTDGSLFPMAGIIEAECVMYERLKALGYVEVETTGPSILGPEGTRMRGHQFRYSEIRPTGRTHCIYRVKTMRTGEMTQEGYMVESVVASYVHLHWAYNRAVPESLVRACRSYRRNKDRWHG